MNPKDIMTDAIHNFHPQYQQYTQYSSGWFFLSTFSTLKPKISLCRVCGMFRSFLRACQTYLISCVLLLSFNAFRCLFSFHYRYVFHTFGFLSCFSYLLQK